MKIKSSFLINFIIALAAVATFSIALYLPAFSIIADQFKVPTSHLQFSLSILLIGSVFSSVVSGVLADLIGRIRYISLSLIVCIYGLVLIVFSENIYFFLLGRFFEGMAMGGITVVTKSIAKDEFPGKVLNQVISIVFIFISVIAIISPIVGGYIIHFLSWRVIFIFLIFYTSILLLLNHFYVAKRFPYLEQKAKHPLPFIKLFKEYLGTLLHQELILKLFILIMVFSIQYINASIVPVMLYLQFHMLAAQIGIFLAVLEGFEISGMVLSIFLNKYFSSNKIILFGLLITLLSCLLILSINPFISFSSIAINTLIGVVSFGSGIALPNILSEILKVRVATVAMIAAISSTAEITFSSFITSLISVLHIKTLFGLALTITLISTMAIILFLRFFYLSYHEDKH